jgi:arginyl-tRNA synthetase
MHVGHGRGAVVGDCAQALLRWAGFDVTREYYVNDYGAQVQTLARSVHLRYQELHGRAVTMPPKSYPGDYVKDIAAKLKAELGDEFLDAPEQAWLGLFRDRAVEHVLGLIREDLAAINIQFDRWSSEKALYESGTVDRFVRMLEEKDLVYVGKLPPPKSKKGQPAAAPPQPDEDGVSASDDLTLFRSSSFGDEVDRPIKKADGTPTYFCADIAYHWDKKQRADVLVDVLGADHGGYIPRLEAALEALGGSRKDLHVIVIQMVRLLRDGVEAKMGKRSGNVVNLRDVVDEVGLDATRYMFLTRRADTPLDFDLALATKKDLSNPVYYAQYGHARISSIFAKAAKEEIPVPEYDLDALRTLTLPAEQELIRRIDAFPDMLAGAALAYEPHRVAYYLHETIAVFHSYYTQGSGDPALRVIGPDPVVTRARLYLCRALQRVLANGLAVLGVSAPDRLEVPQGEEPVAEP